jgi:hypothetical protein
MHFIGQEGHAQVCVGVVFNRGLFPWKINKYEGWHYNIKLHPIGHRISHKNIESQIQIFPKD